MMSRFLSKKGHNVTAVASAEEARKTLDNDATGFDLLVSDVVLAGETGLELAEFIIKHKPHMKVLLCSGYEDKKSHRATIADKGFRFLQKPFSAPAMLSAVHEVMS